MQVITDISLAHGDADSGVFGWAGFSLESAAICSGRVFPNAFPPRAMMIRFFFSIIIPPIGLFKDSWNFSFFQFLQKLCRILKFAEEDHGSDDIRFVISQITVLLFADVCLERV